MLIAWAFGIDSILLINFSDALVYVIFWFRCIISIFCSHLYCVSFSDTMFRIRRRLLFLQHRIHLLNIYLLIIVEHPSNRCWNNINDYYIGNSCPELTQYQQFCDAFCSVSTVASHWLHFFWSSSHTRFIPTSPMIPAQFEFVCRLAFAKW